ASRFGSSLIQPDGELDRKALGHIVFPDPDARKDLEAIIHPFVYRAINDWFASLESSAGFGLADIPLLYEPGDQRDFDRVDVATCSEEQQVERLRGRGLTQNEARQRIASQSPLAGKVARADYVINTSRSVEETNQRIEEVWKNLKTLAELPAIRP